MLRHTKPAAMSKRPKLAVEFPTLDELNGDSVSDQSDDNSSQPESDDQKAAGSTSKSDDEQSEENCVQPADIVESDSKDSDSDSDSNSSDVGAEEQLGEEAFVTDLAQIRKQVEDSVFILCNWKDAKDDVIASGETRRSIFAQLVKKCHSLYGWTENVTEYFLNMFTPEKAIEFFESCDRPVPDTIRVNTIKIKRKELAAQLAGLGIKCKMLPWTKVGMEIVDATQYPSTTAEYMAGFFYIQGAQSMVPVLALGVQKGEKVIDMAAAPGGKSTHIGQILSNTGELIVNEVDKARCKSLQANLHRCGIWNFALLNEDGAKLPEMFQDRPYFDRVLLDAPCSGTGTAWKDPEMKSRRTTEDFKEHAHVQKKLLEAAIKLCDADSKEGGFIVYSTCSLAVEENEEVVDWGLRNFAIRIIPFEPQAIGTSAFTEYRGRHFDKSMKFARRFFPHEHKMEGFFVVKLQKLHNGRKQKKRPRS